MDGTTEAAITICAGPQYVMKTDWFVYFDTARKFLQCPEDVLTEAGICYFVFKSHRNPFSQYVQVVRTTPRRLESCSVRYLWYFMSL